MSVPDVPAWLRFFRSELRIVFGRGRNQALLAAVALFPLLIGVALRLAAQPGVAGGPSFAFIGQLAVTFAAAGVALAAGAALFPLGPVTLLSGSTVPLTAGIVRLLLVTLYVAAAMASLGAIGLALSTLTEHPVGAIAALAVLVVASEIADNLPQLGVIHPYLPTHWWTSFDALLRVPAGTGTLLGGLASFGGYLLLSGAVAWARLSTADITC